MMTPLEYVETIVVPTVKEALADRGDRRRCYLACIVVFHIADYLAGGDEGETSKLLAAVQCECRTPFEVVRGIANGSKHSGGKKSAGGEKRKWFVPRSEKDVPEFAWDIPGRGFDDGRWDSAGLTVDVEGKDVFIDLALQKLLWAFCRLHPDRLASVDLSFLD